MNADEPSWELYRSFLAVFREGSLSGAARATGLTQPTIGRHVDALEEALGAALFTRARTGLRPTPVASALVPHVEAMAVASAALRRAASGEALGERGAVRVTAPDILGVEVLPPALASFREAHPAIDVELALSNRTADLSRREADIAVRTVKPTQSSLVARKIGVTRIRPHAHPRYLQAHGTPRSLEALQSHPIIGFDSVPSIRPMPKTPIPITRELFAFRCDSDVGQYAALKAGFGVGFCQVALGKKDGLTVLPIEGLEFELGIWLVVHRDTKGSRRVRLLLEHLAGYLKGYLS